MKKIIIALLLVPSVAFTQLATNDNLVTVVGTAEKEIEPDWAVLSMSVEETENTKKESEVVQAEIKVSSFLESIGLDPASLSIDTYSAYSNNLSSSSKFKLSKSYKLKVDDVSHLDTIIDMCFKSGMNNISVLEAGHSEIDTYLTETLKEAAKNAKQKASLLSETLNFSLGAVYSIDERYMVKTDNYDFNDFGEYYLENVVVTGYGSKSKQRIGSTIGLKKIKLSKTVIVKFEIE